MAQTTFGTVSVDSPLLPGSTCPSADALSREPEGFLSFDISRQTLSHDPLVVDLLGATPGQLKTLLVSLFSSSGAPHPPGGPGDTCRNSRVPGSVGRAALAQCRDILLPLAGIPSRNSGDAPAVRGAITLPQVSGDILRLELRASRVSSEPSSRKGRSGEGGENSLLLARLRPITGANHQEEALRSRIAFLEKELALRDTLLSEVQHRVKNDLTLVRSFLSLQASGASRSEVRLALEEAVNRVGTLARVYERISGSGCGAIVDLQAMLRDLVHDVSRSHGDPGDAIVCAFPGEPLLLPSRIAVSLGIIVNELVTNAYKYGRCAESAQPVDVAVHLDSDQQGQIVVAVSDSGGCIPEGLSCGDGAGLGLRLVQALAERHDGAVTIVRNGESRVEVALRVPPADLALGSDCQTRQK
ncbi:sensor histidine kinase [Alkalispirochaeta alkalica]|uniref:sensor histidine kinase n=1 Tax=Alkalispirochaeta alkalica TaxID=46356 RepID=UPI0003734E31|nr:sensor histidine kinase [Alkalispirochaeta alkalica]